MLVGMLAGAVLMAAGGGDAGLATLVGTQAVAIQNQLRYSRGRGQEADRDSSSAWPLCALNTSKSRTDPGSVAMTRSSVPGCIPFSAFFAFRSGIGQVNPLASSSVSVSSAMARKDSSWRCQRRASLIAKPSSVALIGARLPGTQQYAICHAYLARPKGWRSKSSNSSAFNRPATSAPASNWSARSRFRWCRSTICSSMVPSVTSR